LDLFQGAVDAFGNKLVGVTFTDRDNVKVFDGGSVSGALSQIEVSRSYSSCDTRDWIDTYYASNPTSGDDETMFWLQIYRGPKTPQFLVAFSSGSGSRSFVCVLSSSGFPYTEDTIPGFMQDMIKDSIGRDYEAVYSCDTMYECKSSECEGEAKVGGITAGAATTNVAGGSMLMVVAFLAVFGV
jgi:hypothetical protein